MSKETSMARSGGSEERWRRDGGGETDPLPQSEANRANHEPDSADDPLDDEPSRSAVRNQSEVRPEDYKGASESAGSVREDNKR